MKCYRRRVFNAAAVTIYKLFSLIPIKSFSVCTHDR